MNLCLLALAREVLVSDGKRRILRAWHAHLIKILPRMGESVPFLKLFLEREEKREAEK